MGERKLGRRELIELLGGMAVLAACGSSAAKRVARHQPGPPARPDRDRPPPLRWTDRPSRHRSGSLEPALTRFRDLYTGKWTGAWVEDGGRRGTGDASITLDVERRVATCTVGFRRTVARRSSPQTTTYVVGVDQYDANSEHAAATSPQLGRIEVTIDGFGHVQLRATDIPGHRDSRPSTSRRS